MGLSFHYTTTATIGDTDVMQAVYFAHFFKIQGTVRELWVRHVVRNSERHLREGLLLLTRHASCDYHRHFRLFDPINCRMQIRNLRKASAELVFRFYHETTGVLHAQGLQVVAFADSGGRLCRMPDEFREAAQLYAEDPAPEAAVA